LHLKRKLQSRQHKNIDKQETLINSTMKCICFDLEQVLPSPCSNVSTLFYKRKLSCYNLTVYDMATKDATLYMWHEAIAGRGSNEIASCVFDYLKSLPSNVTDVIMYSDTCGGQNRNINFSTMCLYATAKCRNLMTVHHKYMESGHSHMEVDSVHSMVERTKKSGPIYSPVQWYQAARLARKSKPYVVKELHTSDFYNFSKNTNGDVVPWLKLKYMCYTKERPDLVLYKTDLDKPEFHTLVVSQTRGKAKDVSQCILRPLFACADPPKISMAKYKDLQDLCKSYCIPKEHHAFYAGLRHSANAADCDRLAEQNYDDETDVE